MTLSDWTCDLGTGPKPVQLPHAWGPGVDVRWEGPAVYRRRIEVPVAGAWLRFGGVSYHAAVSLNGQPVAEHAGIWDAWEVDLRPWAGQSVEVMVQVTKNGGETYPVREVLSGFLPYVYHTFGGIHGEVELVAEPLRQPEAAEPRVRVDGTRVFYRGVPFFLRGLLHWGWYPELGHTHPPEATIRREVRAAKALGFNCVKFCLWVPTHRYLEILEEEGMVGWMELPLWDPSPEPARLQAMGAEILRVVEQYRHHPNILAWTVGCELHASTPAEFRQGLVAAVKHLTGSPLVKDNSGSAEMYGGDLREYGDFDDFHPYGDTHFYAPLLESLMPGPRPRRPIFLGEFNDYDTFRSLVAIAREQPYWASPDPALNDQGVRWQHDLPGLMDSAWTRDGARSERLRASSVRKGAYLRRKVFEAVRAREEIAGTVVTGWRDTPISTSGLFDDAGEPTYPAAEVLRWNSADMLFLIPTRRPPWVHGGNRPGWLDTQVFFADEQAYLRIGLHSEGGREGSLRANLGEVIPVAGRAEPCTPTLVGEVSAHLASGAHDLRVEFGSAEATWRLWAVPREDWAAWEGWTSDGRIPGLALPGGPAQVATALPGALPERLLLFLHAEDGTLPRPFWRECTFDLSAELAGLDAEELWFGVAGDRALDPEWLRTHLGEFRTLWSRVDTRTYEELPIVAAGDGWVATTLRPQGGLGSQPYGLRQNPSGHALMRALRDLLG